MVALVQTKNETDTKYGLVVMLQILTTIQFIESTNLITTETEN